MMPKPGYLSVGDMFITSGALVYIPYSTGETSGSVSPTAGLLLGGVPGAAAAYLVSRPQPLRTFLEGKEQAKKARDNDWGLSVDDRLRRRGGTVILRSAVRSVETEVAKGIVSVSHTDGSMPFIVADPEACQVEIKQWIWGDVRDEPDALGANSGRPSVYRLLAALEAATPYAQQPAAVQRLLLSNRDYWRSLFSLYEERTERQQAAVAATLGKYPRALVTYFAERLIAHSGSAQQLFGGLLTVACLLTVCLIVYDPEIVHWLILDISGNPIAQVGLALLAVSVAAGLLLGIVGALAEWRRYGRLARLLRDSAAVAQDESASERLTPAC